MKKLESVLREDPLLDLLSILAGVEDAAKAGRSGLASVKRSGHDVRPGDLKSLAVQLHNNLDTEVHRLKNFF